jgi:DNA-binding GntR family transcriptional regulator
VHKQPETDLAASRVTEQATDVADIVRQLEEDIVLWRLLPKERLVEDTLMARFGAKRHQVRSALDELQRMGLVERIRNRGVQVRHYDDEETAALCSFRTLIEPAAVAEMSLPPSPEAMAELRAIQDLHDAACDAGDLVAVFRTNAAFHRSLFSLCPNPFLVAAIERAALQAHAVRFAAVQEQAALDQARQDHHAILDALMRNDPEFLRELFRQHLLNALDVRHRMTRALREGTPQPLSR